MASDGIEIVDEFLSEHEWECSAQALSGEVWQYGWPERSTSNERPVWHIFIAGKNRPNEQSCLEELERNTRWNFLSPVWKRVKEQYMPEAELRGVYANGHTYGLESRIHRDSRQGEVSRTALIFLHRFWAMSWGGETCFYQGNSNDLIKAVLPKPNRMIVFDGEIPHNVRSPAISCEFLRISIAFKTHIKFE